VGIFASVIVLAGFIYYMSTAGSTSSATAPATPGKSKSDSRTQPAAPSYAAKAIEFGTEGIGAGQFKDARSVAVDSQGHVYVAEYSGGRLQVFDSQGKFLTQWMLDGKRSISNIAVDRKGGLYVAYWGEIMKYDTSTGELVGEITKSLPGSEGLYQDVFVALDGSLYSLDSRSNLFQFAPDGKIKRVLKLGDKTGEDTVSFERVAVSGSGEIYLLDRSKGVFKFTSDGRYINKFVGSVDRSGAYRPAFNLAVDGSGRVYVSDPDGISVYDSNGRFIDRFGDDQVVFGIVIDDKNSLWATLRNKHTVAQFLLPRN
jgi:NHL repeat